MKKAHEILADAKETADETMRNFHKFGKANISVAEMEKERERLRKKMNATQNSMKTDTKKPKRLTNQVISNLENLSRY